MSTPVINPNTGVLGFSTGQFVTFQCSTMDGQTGTWSIVGSSPLPAGLSINATTGMISGIPTTPAVAINTVIQFNSSNGTATLPVTFGIADCGFSTDIGIEVDLDLITGALNFPTASDNKLHGKAGDYLCLLIGTKKSSVLLDLPLVGITTGIKEFETDPAQILSPDPTAFTKVGSYQRTRWRAMLYLDPAKLAAAFGDAESNATVGDGASDDKTDPSQLITAPELLCEIRLDIQQTDTTLSPSVISRRSQIFSLVVERSVTPAL